MASLVTDVPLAPSPEFSVVNVSTVRVEWAAPFTWQGFPITNYTVTVEVSNQTSAEWVELVSVLSPNTLSFNLTKSSCPLSCMELSFLVTATSEVGTSLPGTVQGRFAAGS